jgi:hypothetical protein
MEKFILGIQTRSLVASALSIAAANPPAKTVTAR